MSFSGDASGKESTCNAEDAGSIPGSGRYPGIGKGSPLQHSCLENSIDRGAWQATVHGATKSQTQLSKHIYIERERERKRERESLLYIIYTIYNYIYYIYYIYYNI